ncbi:MAG: transglutaminase, partial [Armatimonadetes bacterium]|nr:transglutaminase [Armatimonadota bacterium]
MSFDGLASPVVRFHDIPRVHVEGRVPCGWGFAWYPDDDSAAVVVKDPNSAGDDEWVRVLHDWSRFHASIFVAFVLGAARRRTQQDTHPFQIRHAGRDWVLTHNGTLRDFKRGLPLGQDTPFEPAGRTDSEHVLCWLVTRLREAGARTLADYGWDRLQARCAEINALGTANLVLSDGHDLVVYHDRHGHQELHVTRRLPDAPGAEVRLGIVGLDLSDARERNRTVVLFSSIPPEGEAWTAMAPGQMVVARRGAIVWDSTHGGRPPTRRAPLARELAPPKQPPSGDRLDPEVHPAVADAAIRAYLPPEAARPGRTYAIHHETRYKYARNVARSMHLLRLRPVHDPLQELLEHSLEVSVRGVHRNFEDVFGNYTTQIDVETPFKEMRVVSRSIVRVHARAYDALEYPNRRMTMPLVWMPWQRRMMDPYLLPPEMPETQLLELSEFAMAAAARNDSDLLETLLDLNQTLFQDFKYVPGATNVMTSPFEVYYSRQGVCQDFANLLICLARLLGVPARYRTGYVHTGADYSNHIQSEASHAWVELYLPWIGWRGFDPTNGYMVGADHVRVACGRN